MNFPLRPASRRWLFTLALTLVPALGHARAANDMDFRNPTKEELAMTELPGYPGASAVVLNRVEEDNNDLHYFKRYERIKILTEKGKDLANVELRFVSAPGDGWSEAYEQDVTDIAGRTIHPDGTVIPFTGKPYLKTIEKANGFKIQARVFTLPDVEVGSIIEYRYAIRMNDHWFDAPDWFIQGDLYVKNAKYTWRPTRLELQGQDGGMINSITWFPILPEGVKVEKTELPGNSADAGYGPSLTFAVTVKDVPPAPHEDHQPPIDSFTYRVLFNFSEYRSVQDYWRQEGKRWSKRVDNFIDLGGDLRSIADKITAGATSSEDKVKKIYAAVEALENSDYTREHNQQEDKAAGLRKASNAANVYQNGRGTSRQITELFIGLCRAAGLKAYAMEVPSRAHTLFVEQWLSTYQFDDMIAIVNMDGKDVFFDPGERYTPYSHLAWQHTFVRGIRQVDGGTEIGTAGGEGYANNRTTRVANLKMDEKGEIEGKIDVSFTGDAAARWRQTALAGDDESIRRSLRRYLEGMLPKSIDVKVDTLDNLTNYEQPLQVHYHVKGAIGTATGKRLLVPADIFVANEPAAFPHDKRELAVYFHYPEIVQDALRIAVPDNMQVEAIPDSSKTPYTNLAGHNITITSDKKSFTTRRNFIIGTIMIPQKEYPQFRTFYSTLEAKDKETVVLTAAPAAATSASTAAAGSGAN